MKVGIFCGLLSIGLVVIIMVFKPHLFERPHQRIIMLDCPKEIEDGRVISRLECRGEPGRPGDCYCTGPKPAAK